MAENTEAPFLTGDDLEQMISGGQSGVSVHATVDGESGEYTLRESTSGYYGLYDEDNNLVSSANMTLDEIAAEYNVTGDNGGSEAEPEPTVEPEDEPPVEPTPSEPLEPEPTPTPTEEPQEPTETAQEEDQTPVASPSTPPDEETPEPEDEPEETPVEEPAATSTSSRTVPTSTNPYQPGTSEYNEYEAAVSSEIKRLRQTGQYSDLTDDQLEELAYENVQRTWHEPGTSTEYEEYMQAIEDETIRLMQTNEFNSIEAAEAQARANIDARYGTAPLNSEELAQLENDIKVYMQEHNVSEAEAREICTKALEEQKAALNKTTEDNKYEETNNKQRLNSCLEKKEHLNSELKSVKDILTGDNKQKATKLRDSLSNLVSSSPIISSVLTNYSGESSQEYELYVEELRNRLDIVVENASTTEVACKLIDEELIPALERLAEIDEERETIRIELEAKKSEYDTLIASKPSKTIRKTYIDQEHQTQYTVTVTNPDYTTWLNNKADKEIEIENLVQQIEALDKEGKEKQDLCYMILGQEADLEALLKDFEGNPGAATRRKTGGNGGNRSTEPETTAPTTPPEETTEPESTEPETTEPPELPDNSQDQMSFYEGLSMEELSDISTNLQSFATENEMTLEQLLNDDSSTDLLIEYILNSNDYSDELKTLVREGNRQSTQRLLREVLEGQNVTKIGIDADTIEVFKKHLTKVATDNNTTLEELIKNSDNSETLKSSLNNYKDIIGTLKGKSESDIKQIAKSYYDGDNVEQVPTETLDIFKDFIDDNADKKSIDSESYLYSDSIVDELKRLGKTSVLVNNISDYSNENLSKILSEMLLK